MSIPDQFVFSLKVFRSVPAIFSGVAVFMIVLGSICIVYTCIASKKMRKIDETKKRNGVHSSQVPEAEPLKV